MNTIADGTDPINRQSTMYYRDMSAHRNGISNEPIALVGMACTFAGGIDTPDLLWEHLVKSTDIGTEIPKDRFDIESFAAHVLETNPTTKKNLVRRGYFLDNDVLNGFDPSFFGITDGDATKMDPCHRILLEKFVHLIEDAGYTMDQIKGTQTAVYIAQFTRDHEIAIDRQDIEVQSRLFGTNVGIFNASARISYHFDLHGPNIAFNTACSSSLQAVHLAIQSLRKGEANLACAGGVNTNYTPESLFAASLLGAISPDGRSRAYDINANGYAKGEGVGLVLLKRLSDAIKDKNHIYCIIRDVMSNHDGNQEKISYTVPSPYGQNLLLNQIYSRNKIDLKNVFYVEGHGTGTQVGDPIEANTLGKFFSRTESDSPLLIGSVKSNIGHTEAAAGVAALIKVALCMKHRMLVPNMHFSRTNPKIHATKYNLKIVNDVIQFPNNKPVTIGINSFGIGGNNAHAIVSEWYNPISQNEQQHDDLVLNGIDNIGENHLDAAKQYFILMFSTNCSQSMKNQIERFSRWLSKLPEQLNNKYQELFLAYLSEKLLLQRTTSFPHRTTFVFANIIELQNQLTSVWTQKNCSGVLVTQQRQQKNPLNICFVFSGQGPQWWKMGRELYFVEPVFHSWINKISEEFSVLTKDWTLVDELINTKDESDSRINDTNIAQPAIFAIQVALTALWNSWNVYPKVIIGHSVGEIAAAFVSGKLTLQEALKIVYHRSILQHRNTRQNGRMLAVSISESEARSFIASIVHRVDIAAINSPKSVTLSGDSDVLQEVYNILDVRKPKAFKAWLKIENAFHSQQMERFNIREDLIDVLSDVKGCNAAKSNLFDVKYSDVHHYSTVTGSRVSKDFSFNNQYWWENVRRTVLFRDGIQSIFNDWKSNPIQVFIEISPHPVLTTVIEECFDSYSSSLSSRPSSPLILHSLKRKENEQQTILTSFSRLYSIDWKRFLKSRYHSQLIEQQTTNHHKNEILKSIFSHLHQVPHYTFNRQIYWYESKDSVFTRRAIRRQHHPLLGIRLWHNEAITPTWKNQITLSNKKYEFIRDHTIQGNILFPGTGFIELASAAVDELSSSSISFLFGDIQFSNALLLKENETTEIHTIIVMPYQQFFIYSRRNNSKDFIRTSGISGNDIDTGNRGLFNDEKLLNEYSSQEWILHAQGTINTKTDITLHSSLYNIDSILNRFKHVEWLVQNENDIKRLYAYFSRRGYNYGPYFQGIKSIKRTRSETLAEIRLPSIFSGQDQDQEKYYLHPALFDICVHSVLSILPGHDTFVPTSIEKVIMCQRLTPKMVTDENIFIYSSFRMPVRGVTTEETYITDILIFTRSNIIAIVSGINFRQIPGNEMISSQSIFEKFDNYIFNPTNNNNSLDIDQVIERYCLQKRWKPCDYVESLLTKYSLTPDRLLKSPIDIDDDGNVQRIENIRVGMHDGISEIDKDIYRSGKIFNKLAALYVVDVMKKLLLNNEVEFTQSKIESLICSKHHKLMNSMLIILQDHHFITKVDDTNSWKFIQDIHSVNDHTNNLLLVEILKDYPRLKSFVSILASCGTNLLEILTGQLEPLQVLFGAENEKMLQELYSIISKTLTKLIFSAMCNYFKTQITTDDHEHIIRILEIGGGTGASTVFILDMLLDFANNTQTRIEYTFTDISVAFFAKAQQTFAELLKKKNQKNLLVIKYEIFDLDKNSLHQQTMYPESYDIIFAASVIHVATNLVDSVSSLRQLLVPGGLCIFLEPTTASLSFFDLIFGLLPQWWNFSPDDPIRKPSQHAIVTTDQWVQTFQLAKGFDSVEVASTADGNMSTIIAQKSSTESIIQHMPERLEQAWLVFGDEKQKIGWKIGTKLKEKFPENNITIVSFQNTYQDSDKLNVYTVNSLSDVQQLLRDTLSKHLLLNVVFTRALDLENFDDKDESLLTSDKFQKQEDLGCGSLMYIVQSILLLRPEMMPNIFVITQNAQPEMENNLHLNFIQAPVIGFARSIIKEYAQNRFRLIDIPQEYQSNLFDVLLNEFLNYNNSLFEEEVVLRYNEQNNHLIKMISHFEKMIEIEPEQSQNITIIPNRDSNSVAFKLQVPKTFFLSNLQWATFDRDSSSILSHQIEVQIHSVGISFRDVLKVRGLYPHIRQFGIEYKDQEANARDEEIGFDFSGIITRLGSNVGQSFHIGDRVFGKSIVTGTFKSHIIVDPYAIVQAPENLTMEQLCTVPVSFLTAVYALYERANLKPGQTVLIHTATGAVGLALIQLCRRRNATIIATAGTQEKRKFLRDECHIEYVFNSRDLSFVDNIRQIFPNGVDVIVNSLAGEFLQESIKLLAPHGHFVEIGKRDVFSNSKLPLFQFRNDCSSHIVDLFTLETLQPEKTHSLLQDISNDIKEGLLVPITPMTVFEPSEVVRAFQFYSQATHIGKLVLRITGSDKELTVVDTKEETKKNVIQTNSMFSDSLCTNGTVVISGGLGGIAIEISKWMIKERGVKRIVLMARKTVDELKENSVLFQDWEILNRIAKQYESYVELVQVDVTKFDQVFDVIHRINQTEYPVRGIIHTAMVLHDTLISNMTQEMLTKVMRPKIHGAWNLHNATQLTNSPLGFFVMLSSIQNHYLIEMGQSNYNAGNHFLDALAYWRYNHKNLPALSISLPGISGAGFIHKNVDSAKLLRDYAVPATYMFKMIEQFHQKQQTSTKTTIAAPIIFLIKWSEAIKRRNLSKNLLNIAEEFVQIEKTEESSNDTKITLTTALNSTTIRTEIHTTVSKLFGSLTIDRVDPDKPLIQQGMDSLVAVELHNWLGKQMNVFLSVVEILRGMSINDIGNYIYSKLLKDNHNVATTNDEKVENELLNNNEIDQIENDSSFDDANSDELLQMENSSIDIQYDSRSNPRASLAQERIYLHEKIYFDQKNSAAIYNVPFVLQISRGTISIKRLRQALLTLIRKHQVLRTGIKYSIEDECLKQYITPMTEVNDDDVHDKQDYYSFQVSKISTNQELETILKSERQTTHFKIESGLVLRCHIVLHQLSIATVDDENLILHVNDYIIFNIHHIAIDAHSVKPFVQDLKDAYVQQNLKIDLNEYFQYADYTRNEWELLDDESFDSIMNQARQYWKDLLNGYDIDKQLKLPYDHELNQVRTSSGASIQFKLNETIVRRIVQYAQEMNATVFQVCLACYYIFLFKLTNNHEKDICIGGFVANRYRQELENLLGYFVNTLPYRLKIDPQLSFSQILLQVQQLSLDLLKYSYLPYQEIIQLHRHTTTNINQQKSSLSLPFIQTVFIFLLSNKYNNNIDLNDGELSVITDEELGLEKNISLYDLSLSMKYDATNSTMVCTFDYSTDLFEQKTIENICERFQILLNELFLTSFNIKNQSIYELSILLPDENQLINRLNANTIDFDHSLKCIHQEYLEQAYNHPQKVAIELDEQSLTYAEMIDYSQKLALVLIQEYHVKPQDIICQCVERSIEMVVGIIAIMMAGCSYCPLSFYDPIDRLSTLIGDTKSTIVLCHSLTKTKFIELEKTSAIRFVPIDEILMNYSSKRILQEELNLLSNIKVKVDDLAYIIFTSGSTGTPKPVKISHKNFVGHMKSLVEANIINKDDIIIQITPCSFDVHLLDILGCLTVGATLVMLKPNGNLDMNYLSSTINEKQVTFIAVVPTVMRTLCEFLNDTSQFNRIKTLRSICSGGEMIQRRTISKLKEHIDPKSTIVNLYGPAECTIECTYHFITIEDLEKQSIPIGRPLAGYQCYILDEYQQTVRVNEIGELYISGIGVFNGYFDRDDLTKEVLIDIPHKGICYKTGDLCKYDSNGLIHYEGRIDNQVKLRGQRIEINEIELTLSRSSSDIVSCLVKKVINSATKQEYLAAYLQVSNGIPDIDHETFKSQIKEYCRSHLPQYMIPSLFIILDKLPLSSNGKIDRKQLPQPNFEQMIYQWQDVRLDSKKTTCNKSTTCSMSKMLTTSSLSKGDNELRGTILNDVRMAWNETLHHNSSMEEIDVDAHFFEVGGHSLLIFKLLSCMPSYLKEHVILIDLLTYPTISSLANYLEKKIETRSTSKLEQKATLIYNNENTAKNDVAIIGLAGRFPGANNVEEFWTNLVNGQEHLVQISEDDLREEGVDDEQLSDPHYVKVSGLLGKSDTHQSHRHHIFGFDANFFGYSFHEAESMDPQQRLFLEICYQALEDAGLVADLYQSQNKTIGVYGCIGWNSYYDRYIVPHCSNSKTLNTHSLLINNEKDFLSTRVAFKLNLHGPAFVIQTACSSSLVAVHTAKKAIENGECDVAIAGGVSLGALGKHGYLYTPGHILSPDGHCRALDENANGTVSGQGLGVVVLKSIIEAKRDHDHIYAIIVGSAVNNDGSNKLSYAAPNPLGQQKVIQKALVNCHRSDVSQHMAYIECHGTGTKLGDMIELNALKDVYSNEKVQQSIVIGSVKSNIGHLDAAAGVTGLIKAALIVHRRQIPPSVHCQQPNSLITDNNTIFRVNTTLNQLSSVPSPIYTSVSSFGIGGTNSHMIIEQYQKKAMSASVSPLAGYHVLCWTAKTSEAAEKMRLQFLAFTKSHLETGDISYRDIAYTSQIGRIHYNSARQMIVAKDLQHATQKLLESTSTIRVESSLPAVIFVFPGQENQYNGMGVNLYQQQKSFRLCVDELWRSLQQSVRSNSILYHSSTVDIIQTLSIDHVWNTCTDHSLSWLAPIGLFMLEYCLAKWLTNIGVKMDACMGHCLGHYVSTVMSGMLGVECAMLMILKRSELLHMSANQEEQDTMLAIDLDANTVTQMLPVGANTIAINSPRHVTIAGSSRIIADIHETLKMRAVPCALIRPTQHGFPSQLAGGIQREFEYFIEELNKKQMNKPIQSTILCADTVTDTFRDGSVSSHVNIDVTYWINQWHRKAQFSSAFEQLITSLSNTHQDYIFLHVAPGKRCFNWIEAQPSYQLNSNTWTNYQLLSSHQEAMTINKNMDYDDEYYTLTTLGECWKIGMNIQWNELYAHCNETEHPEKVSLPLYPFNHDTIHMFNKQRTSHCRQSINIRPSKQISQESAVMNHVTEPKTIGADDIILQKVTCCFAAVFGGSSVSYCPTSDFFALGGHSMSAIQLVTELNTTFGLPIEKELNPDTLLKYKTITKLTELIRTLTHSIADEEKQKHSKESVPYDTNIQVSPSNSVTFMSYQSLYILQEGDLSSRSLPLVFIHPISGDIYSYQTLSSHLSPDQLIMAFRPPSLDGIVKPHTLIVDMAKDYLETLMDANSPFMSYCHHYRSNHPTATNVPFLLAGWSFGGLVAYEMMSQLSSNFNSCFVHALFLLDSPAPGVMINEDANEMDEADVLDYIVHHASSASSYKSITNELRKAGDYQEMIKLAESYLPSNIQLHLTPSLLSTWLSHATAMRTYCESTFIRTYPCTIVYFSPKEEGTHPKSPRRSLHLDWLRVVKDQLTFVIVNVPGNHVTMMQTTHMAEVGKHLKNWCEIFSTR